MCIYFIEVKFINLINPESMGLIFNSLDPTFNGENMRFWLAFFIELVLAYEISISHEEHIIQQLKA